MSVAGDHVVPVMSDGGTVLGNMVLACSRCDDSKGRSNFDEWMLGGAPQSPHTRGVPDVDQRIARIKSYSRDYGYAPSAPESWLGKAEAGRLEAIRKRLSILREDVEGLIGDYQKRTAKL